MHAFEYDKSSLIIYNNYNLLFNKYLEIQNDCRSFKIILATKLWLLRC